MLNCYFIGGFKSNKYKKQHGDIVEIYTWVVIILEFVKEFIIMLIYARRQQSRIVSIVKIVAVKLESQTR